MIFSRAALTLCPLTVFLLFCIDVLAPATHDTAAGRELASQHEVNERLKVRRRGRRGRPVVVFTCSWSSVHQHVPTDAEHHRHHHQHSQHCAHHRFLNSSVSLLSGAGSWLSGGGRGDPELNYYVGSAGTAVTIDQRVIFRAGPVYS